MHLKTAMAQAAIVGGRRYDRAAGILAEECTSRLSRGRSQGSLYVLVEVGGEGPAREELAGELANCICDTYYGHRRSVTASLQHAIREANSLLLDENLQAMRGEQRTAGVSCVVVRDNDLFIAQAGPAALYLLHDQRVTRFPETSPWLDNIPFETTEASPLGQRRDVPVDLFHTPVQGGDTLLLVESGVARHIPKKAWYQILFAPTPERMLGELLTAARGGDLSALALSLGGSGATKAIPTVIASPAPIDATPVPSQPGSSSPPAASPRATAKAKPARPPVAGENEPTPATQERKATGRMLTGAVAATGAAILGLLKQMAPGPTKPVRPSVPETRSTPKMVQAEPKKRPAPRPEAPAARGGPLQKLLLVIALLIPLSVTGIVAYTVVQWGQVKESQVEDLWAQAQSYWVQAQSASEPAAVRTLLGQSQAALEELLLDQPAHAQALELQKRITARLDEANRVRRIRWSGGLASYPASAELSRVVVNGVHVFVMDKDADAVYHHQLDEYEQALQPNTEERVVVRKGDQVGNVLVGELVDMTWMPVGNGRQKAGLVILGSDGVLVDYDPGTGERTSSRAAGSETWKYPQLVGGHTGRLYVLDSSANQIWRYAPTAKGYTAAPDPWLQTVVDLAGVRDMAVSDSIYLLYADGTINRVTAGVPDSFDVSGWDVPPEDPAAIFARPPNESQWVYLADAGNARIVQAGPDGRLERQFRLTDPQGAGGTDPLENVTSLFVDEIARRAFFLSGQELFMIILPD